MIQTVLNRCLVASLPRLLGANGKQRLSILIYHRVLPAYDYMRESEHTAECFDWQMEFLSRHFSPLSLSDALGLMDAGKLPQRAVCVTFDDGYADNALLAQPILEKWRIPATVFVSTKYIDGGRMWNDSVLEALRRSRQTTMDLTSLGLGRLELNSEINRKASAYQLIQRIKYLPLEERQRVVMLVEEQSEDLPENLMLTTEQLRAMQHSGIEIGGHTHSHPILASMADDDAREEIERGKQVLEDALGKPVRFFAYPNGIPGKDYLPVHQKMVKEAGFEAALTTQWGVSDISTDRWQLRRFTPWDKTQTKFITRLLLNLGRRADYC